ncbi:MAG: TIGR03790 family protein, partial [Desulfofustis sp.]|nr:TIGR03790 family protein [Desulfofustis sp.]
MNSLLLRYLLLLSAVLSIFYGPSSVSALLPDEIVVVANSRAADSVKLAKYYMKMRGIPSEHLIKIRTTWEESCARKDYDDNIATPILKAINNLRTSTNIRSIVTMFGVPLKIRPPTLDFDDEEQVNTLRHQLQQLQTQSQTADIQEQPGLKEQVKSLITQIELLLQTNKRASIDSELALVLVEDYPLENWLPNPFFLGFQNKELFLKKDKVLIVSR